MASEDLKLPSRPRSVKLTTGAGGKTRGRRSAAPWWFLIPAVVLYVFIVIVPNVQGVNYAFTDWDGLSADYSYVGFAHFADAFGDDDARASFGHTIFIAVVNTIAQNVIGLLLALGVNSHIKSRNVLRVVFFAPAVMTPIVISYLWKNLLAGDGAVNAVLEAVGLGNLTHSWLGEPKLVLWAVVFVMTWQFAGYSMVIYLAGLQAIPEELYEAGAIDGAGALRRFWSITRPLLAPAFTINLLLSVISGIKVFDQVYGLTSGGPGTSSETVTSWIVKNAFAFGDFSYAIALAVLLTLIIAVVSSIQYFVLNRAERSAS